MNNMPQQIFEMQLDTVSKIKELLSIYEHLTVQEASFVENLYEWQKYSYFADNQIECLDGIYDKYL